eukprot:5691605-Pleurochrysis_carterae.AAC.2
MGRAQVAGAGQVPRVSARPCWSASRHERAGGACTPRAPELGNDRSVSSFILGCAAGASRLSIPKLARLVARGASGAIDEACSSELE